MPSVAGERSLIFLGYQVVAADSETAWPGTIAA
jgi:hypothetical protein